METIVINGTQINKDAISGMSYTEFCQIFKGKIKGCSAEDAAAICGIKKRTKSKKED